MGLYLDNEKENGNYYVIIMDFDSRQRVMRTESGKQSHCDCRTTYIRKVVLEA